MFVCAQVISTEKSGNHIFRLTGPGADQDPKGLFIIDIDTGEVSVSRSLDREATDSYQVCVCAFVRSGSYCVCIFLSHLCVHLGTLSFADSFPCQFWYSCNSCFVHRLFPFQLNMFMIIFGSNNIHFSIYLAY